MLKTIRMPTQLFSDTWNRIPKYTKITFFATIIVGILIHIFLITNKFTGHDDLYTLFSSLHLENYGRWFTFFPTDISGPYSMNPVIVFLSIFFLAVSACVIGAALHIRKTLLCILLGSIVTSFPTVCTFLLCTGGADGTFFGLMLTCVAVYIARRFRHGSLFSIVLITLSLGIYQSFITVVASFFILTLLIDVFGRIPLKTILLRGVKYVLIIVASLACYLIMVKLTATELSSYQNLDQMSSINIAELPALLVTAYKEVARFFLRNSFNAHYEFMDLFYALLFVCAALLLIWIVVQRKLYKNIGHLVLLLILLCILPLAINTLYLTAAEKVHMGMMYSFAFILIALLALLSEVSETYASNEHKEKKSFCETWGVPLLSWFMTGVLIVTIFGYGIKTNQAYFRQHLVYEHAYSYSSTLLSRISTTESYTHEAEILLVGNVPGFALRDTFIELEPFALFTDPTVIGNGVDFIQSSSYPIFLRSFMGVTQPVALWNGDEAEAPADMTSDQIEAIREMPLYPETGSIQRLGDRLVVRFS